MENFSSNQDQIRQLYRRDASAAFFPINQFEDMARQNIALFQQAATMFSPNADGAAGGSGETSERTERHGQAPHPPQTPSDPEKEIQASQRERSNRYRLS